jgi:hypothetical protein
MLLRSGAPSTWLFLEIDISLPVVVTDGKVGVNSSMEISSGQYIGPSWSTLRATYKDQIWRLEEIMKRSGVFDLLVREARPPQLLFGPSPSQFASPVNAIGIEALCAHRTLQSSYHL